MTTTRRRPLSQEEIELLIESRVAELEVLAARTAVEWWRRRWEASLSEARHDRHDRGATEALKRRLRECGAGRSLLRSSSCFCAKRCACRLRVAASARRIVSLAYPR